MTVRALFSMGRNVLGGIYSHLIHFSSSVFHFFCLMYMLMGNVFFFYFSSLPIGVIHLSQKTAVSQCSESGTETRDTVAR